MNRHGVPPASLNGDGNRARLMPSGQIRQFLDGETEPGTIKAPVRLYGASVAQK
ncbi:Unknown protein sequence [Pseudomonas syringae pv. cilantro]|uniref:Uncharacterized protein n=1 Tax=Pseudomonas syringae pv. cilantro TaxID=81035 RepID=A0A0N0XCE4_PSESX|nr:Unknown protein sequence [Pseudomonas syringae pv. cilantro]